MSEPKPKPPDRRVKPKSTVRMVPIADMRVAAPAQRRFQKPWAEALASMLDLDKLGKPVLNHRDGHWYIIDGQHRVAALKLYGWGDLSLECECFEGLSQEEEAELFLGLNDARPVSTFQKFRIAITANRVRETDIERTVLAQGLKVAPNKQPGATSAVGALTFVWDNGGAIVLGRTLRILRDAYGGVPGTLSSPLIQGLGMVCIRYDGDFEDTLAVDKLAHLMGGANGLMSNAYAVREQTGRQLPDCVAASVVELYNKGRGRDGKLTPWWKR